MANVLKVCSEKMLVAQSEGGWDVGFPQSLINALQGKSRSARQASRCLICV